MLLMAGLPRCDSVLREDGDRFLGDARLDSSVICSTIAEPGDFMPDGLSVANDLPEASGLALLRSEPRVTCGTVGVE